MSVFKHGKSWWYDFQSGGVRYGKWTPAGSRDGALQLEAIRKAQLSGQKTCDKQQSRSTRSAELSLGDFSCWCSVEGRVRRGGILLSAHCDDPEWAKKARDILVLTGAEDISSTSEATADFATSDRPIPRSAAR